MPHRIWATPQAPTQREHDRRANRPLHGGRGRKAGINGTAPASVQQSCPPHAGPWGTM